MKEENNVSLRRVGKVLTFDGEGGKIIDENGNTYAFNKCDIQGVLTKNDVVTFIINHVPFAGEIIEVAKFINKI